MSTHRDTDRSMMVVQRAMIPSLVRLDITVKNATSGGPTRFRYYKGRKVGPLFYTKREAQIFVVQYIMDKDSRIGILEASEKASKDDAVHSMQVDTQELWMPSKTYGGNHDA